jgi:hypothetical protein
MPFLSGIVNVMLDNKFPVDDQSVILETVMSSETYLLDGRKHLYTLNWSCI